MTDIATAAGPGRSPASNDIVEYDYRGGSEFDPGTAEELTGLHKAFCRDLTRHLGHLFQIPVTVTHRSIDEVPYNSYVRSLPSPTVLGVIDMAPTTGRAIVDLPNHLGFAMIDILLGGCGRPTAFRALTELEGSIIRMALDPIAASVAAAFAPAAALNPNTVAVQAHPSINGLLDPDEPTLVMSFTVKIEAEQPTEGILSICYPRSALLSLLAPIPEEEIEITVQAPVNPELFDPLSSVPIDVTARLKASPISLWELAELQPGDVVVLSHKPNEPVTVSAGGFDLLEGHVGQHNNNLALSITRWTV
jgi:flagellar motor switch protein FliM